MQRMGQRDQGQDLPKVCLPIQWETKGGPCPRSGTSHSREADKNGDTVTLQQVKAVAQTVKAIGGFGHLNELLGLVREVGGLRKMKELIGAMSIPETDKTPF